jgi:cation transport ATPase
MATAKKVTTKSKSLSETEKKLEAARKRNKARRATIKINQEKKPTSRKVSSKSNGENKTKTTKTAPTKTTKKSSSTAKKKVSKNTTGRSVKKKRARKIKKTKPLLIHMMDMPRWARFIIYTVILVIVLYGYYLHSKEQLVSTSVDFLNRNIFIIAPLTFVLLYSLTLFYLGYKAGKKE